jgi:protein O-mannosyl-transferase
MRVLRLNVWKVVFLLICTPLVVFWQVHSHEFVLWDDNLNVFANPALRSVTLDTILGFWRAPYAHLYIPFTYTLWALTAAVSRWVTLQPSGGAPLDPQLFHSLNLLVHLVSVLVVWRIVRMLLGRTVREGQSPASGYARTRMEGVACSGALLFAVHPLQVEAVAWVTGLKDILGGCLAFVAIWQYLQYAGEGLDVASSGKPARGQVRRTWIHYGFATGAFMLALLAKPTAVVVPVVAWLLDIWGWPQTWRTRRSAILAWLVIAMLWGIVTSQVQPATTVLFTVPLWMRPLIVGDAVTFYIYKFVFPVWLGPDYGRAPTSVLAQSWLWLTGLVPWGLAVWLWYKRTRVPWLVAAAGVLVAGLLPVLGFIPFGFQNYSTVADRYMYISMLGPALALAWGLAQSPRPVLAIGCVAILGVLGIRSAWQTRYWHTTLSLFEHALTVHPGSALAHNNLGLAMAAQNRLPEAIDHYTEALRLLPSYALAHYNLGHLLTSQGQTQEAMRHYAEAIRLLPTYAEAHNNLGMALANQGRATEAIYHYTEALRLQPRNAEAHNNLGNVLASQGQTQEALRHYTEALRLDPTFAEAHNNLGTALVNQGRATEAIHHYSEALRLQPSYARAHYNLGNVFNRQGKMQEAIQQYMEALRFQPNLAEAHHNLGATLAQEGHITEAIEHYTEALRLRPRYVNAHYNLGVALAKQGRLAEARHHFAEVLRLDPTHAAARQFLESSGQ